MLHSTACMYCIYDHPAAFYHLYHSQHRLKSNQLTDACLESLCSALCTNCSLTEVDLSNTERDGNWNNRFTDTALQEFVDRCDPRKKIRSVSPRQYSFNAHSSKEQLMWPSRFSTNGPRLSYNRKHSLHGPLHLGLSVCWFLSVCLPAWLFFCLSLSVVYLSVCLWSMWFICLSVCCLFVCLSICLSFCLSVCRLFVCLYLSFSIYLPTHLSSSPTFPSPSLSLSLYPLSPSSPPSVHTTDSIFRVNTYYLLYF